MERQTVPSKCSKLAQGILDGNLLFFGAVTEVTRFGGRQHVQHLAASCWNGLHVTLNCLLSF